MSYNAINGTHRPTSPNLLSVNHVARAAHDADTALFQDILFRT